MCRETESDDRCRCGMGKTTSSPLFPSLGTSLKVLLPRVPLEFGASPARSRRRLARPTAKRRKLSSDRKYEDVRVVMRTASNQKRLRGKAGHLRLRFRLLAMEKGSKCVPASRLRHPIPAPHLPHRLTSCGTSHRGAPRASRTARTASSDPQRTQSQPPRRGTETCTER